MKYEIPNLDYKFDDLEPYIDGRTMEIHLTKHHQGYVDNLNKVLEKYPGLQEETLEKLLAGLEEINIDENDKEIIKNNGGGHLNHALFWKIMGSSKELDNKLIMDLIDNFGSIEKFKHQFEAEALKRFGSGWVWLARDKNKKLVIYSLANQDSPYLLGHEPVVGLDVWEHAYYLLYQNKRADYVKNWWHVLKLI